METLLTMELNRLRALAGEELLYADAGIDEQGILNEIRELRDQIEDLEDDIRRRREVIRTRTQGLGPEQKNQLETVLAVCKQYDLPVPKDVQALAKQHKATAPKPSKLGLL